MDLAHLAIDINIWCIYGGI